MKRIAVDMDEVLADFSGHLLEIMNEKLGTRYTKEDTNGKFVFELFPEHEELMREIVHSDQFFRGLPVIEGSQDALERLSEHYEIMIATAAMYIPESFQAKYDWLKAYFPFLNYELFNFCGDKSTIRADYLIDDSPKQLARFGEGGVMFTAARNIEEDYPVRCTGWEEVEAYFMNELKK